jgi:hypothetical protein
MPRRAVVTVTFAIAVLSGCSNAGEPAAPRAAVEPAATIATSGIMAIDISNGVNAGVTGGPRTISDSGVILGRQGSETGSLRGWWQSPSPAFTAIDNGYLQGGNRGADAGGGQATVFLSTNGGAPWSSIAVTAPPGVCATCTLVRDLNDSRVMVGNTLGSNGIFAVEWSSPTAIPARLPTPTFQYPADQVIAASINNQGVIVGYAHEIVSTRGNTQTIRYEALVWSGGIAQILPLSPGATTQLASNVNDAGVISGIAGSHPVRWTPRANGGYDVVASTVDVGSADLYTGIDACGRIVGGSDKGAWVWDGVSPAVFLPSITGAVVSARAMDINDAGTVVGTSAVGSSHGSAVFHATIWIGLGPCTP